MGIANDMKSLAEDIVSSYDLRVKGIKGLAPDVQKTLKGFAEERKRMSERQARELPRFVAGIREGVIAMLKGFEKGHKEMSANLKAKLQGFAKEHEKMADVLVKNLKNGEANRLKDFEELKKEMARYVDDIVKGVSNLLRGFKAEREEMASNWRAMADTMAKRRVGIAPKIEARVKVREVAEAIEEEKEIEEEETAEGGEDIERQILLLLRDYPDGATLRELGDRMGVHFVRLTRLVKDLVDEGMVRKVDNRYALA